MVARDKAILGSCQLGFFRLGVKRNDFDRAVARIEKVKAPSFTDVVARLEKAKAPSFSDVVKRLEKV